MSETKRDGEEKQSEKPAQKKLSKTKEEKKATQEAVNKEIVREKLPELKPGYQIRLHQKIKEGDKERVQVFEGVIISLRGRGISKTITVRKISEGLGVEKIFPLNLPTIIKIEIVKKFKTRRAKLYYLRNKKLKDLKEIKK